MDSTLGALAAAQHGVFTTVQARAVGLGDRHLARLRRDGEIRPVARSVSALATVPFSTQEERLEVLTHGALALYPDARPVGASALVVLGLPVFGVAGVRADVVRPVHREVLTTLCRIRTDASPIRSLTAPTGSPEAIAGALVQMALDHGHTSAVIAADQALNRELVSVGDIQSAAGRTRGWPEYGRVRTMLAFMDGRSQSVGETRLRLFVRGLGWRVTPQRPITENDHEFGQADLGVDGTNLLLEFDGRVKYGKDERALWKEKQREDRGRRAGWLFERVVWADLDRPVVLGARLRAARASAGPPPEPVAQAG